MTRPRLGRRICFKHKDYFFKPQGIPLANIKIIEISEEQAEAVRLKDIEGLSQTECAKKMKTSQSTFQRILSLARKKISLAIIKGYGLKICKE